MCGSKPVPDQVAPLVPAAESSFGGAPVFIAGGLGFLGSTLAHRLVALGADVHLYDALVPTQGGGRTNVEEIAERVRITIADLCDEQALAGAIGSPAFVFDLAGQSSHWDSMVDPQSDLDQNCRARLALLDAVRRRAPEARLVYASTRQIYGRPTYLPVDEQHPLRAVDVNGIHKIAAESYHRLYAELYGLRTTILRLTNTLGPRMRIRDARQTFVGLWIRCALEGQPFEVWGGDQLRDFNDVEDVIDAILATALADRAVGRTYNLGAAPPISLRALAELLRSLTGAPFEIVPFPAERQAIDIGDYYASHERITSELGWRPRRELRATLERTLSYFAPRLALLAGDDKLSRRETPSISAAAGPLARAPRVPVADPRRALLRHEVAIRAAIDRVLASGRYVGGEEVEAFERELAASLGARHAVGVSSGTAALELALRASGIGAGDAVATVSFTAVATVAAIEAVGARPVLVEIDSDRLTLDPASLERLLRTTRVRAIVPVHLHGQPADLPRIVELAARHGAVVIEDCAQAQGATLGGRACGTFGASAAFSFYPTKILGALGDGGAVVTGEAALAERVRLLREYGWRERRVSEIAGGNSRLDPLQAAVLRVKLPHLGRDNERRRALVDQYREQLAGLAFALPAKISGAAPAFHQFVVRSPARDSLREQLAADGIETAIHYELPIHLQPAYRGRLELEGGALPHTERASREVLSLPCYPDLSAAELERVVAAVRAASGGL